MKRYVSEPDYRNVVLAAQNKPAPRLPLYEHLVGGRILTEILGENPYPKMNDADFEVRKEGFREYWRFWRTLGYDTASFECCIGGIFPGGGALGNHVDPVIKTRGDFEKYPWATLADAYFKRFGPQFEALAATCPEGMKVVGGVGNGVFECVQDLVGYIPLCFLKEDDPELYADLFRRVGELQYEIWARFMKEYSDVYCVLRFGDDLGFNSSTLLSADDIREHVMPPYRRITDLVHSYGKPFLLHSCGNLFGVFDDIISLGNIDAKHSNEDIIAHFSVWAERYGDRIGNFGGIDTDVLCRNTPEFIRKYVRDSLERCQGHGGIAFGSGNSIPDYVPTEGYLAMIEAVRDLRGDKVIG